MKNDYKIEELWIQIDQGSYVISIDRGSNSYVYLALIMKTTWEV